MELLEQVQAVIVAIINTTEDIEAVGLAYAARSLLERARDELSEKVKKE